jgi:tetratricopeptide (TPR) repeat protein
MASAADGPLAAWVKAKLALHRGDLDAAAARYAEASRAFPDAPLDAANRTLLLGEQGTLTLARGDYVGALAQLYPVAATYWGDVAHIAERVLTVDELKGFVDAHAGDAAPHPASEADTVLANDPPAQLRALLARRLVRAGRYEEALAYFPAATDPPVRDWVRAYAQAMHDSTARWWAVDRAKAWFDASVIAREHGMEIMAMEGPPDRFVVDGNYACCVAQAKLEGPFITEGEKARFAASVAQPDKRYHYRYVAALEASRAADLLPARSQAFAAVLCAATGYVMNQDPPAAAVFYRRYLRAGAHVPWAAHFGVDCPAPDFAAAGRFPREQAVRDARHFVSRYRWSVGGGILAVLVAGAILVRRVARS